MTEFFEGFKLSSSELIALYAFDHNRLYLSANPHTPQKKTLLWFIRPKLAISQNIHILISYF
jgi:hypothetical protein